MKKYTIIYNLIPTRRATAGTPRAHLARVSAADHFEAVNRCKRDTSADHAFELVVVLEGDLIATTIGDNCHVHEFST